MSEQNNERFKVIDGYDTENNPIKMIEDTLTTEIMSLENELEANGLCKRMNELEHRIRELLHKHGLLLEENYNEVTSLEEENDKLKHRIRELEHECNYLQDMLDDCICTKKENKDLKDDIKELRDKNIRLEDKLFLFPSKGKIIRDEHDV